MDKSTGFTLIELLVTITVSAVLLAIAIPSYQNIIGASRLSTLANDTVVAINEARMEAIRRNTTTQICAASGNGTGALATSCATAAPGAVYATAAAADDDPVLLRAAPSLEHLSIISFQALRYNAQGLARKPTEASPHTGLVADFKSEQLSTKNHRCVYMTTGTSLKTCTTDSACNATTEPADCQ